MMLPVVSGATLFCPMAIGTTTLVANSQLKIMVENKPIATSNDYKLGANILPFALCISMSNPAVAAATAAAMGVLTPQPCTALLVAPWIPEQFDKQIDNMPILTMGSTLICGYGGQIKILNPGQTKLIL